MRHIVGIVILVMTFGFTSYAQDLNTIPPLGVKDRADGWHVYQVQGTTFDVEILGRRLTQGTIIWFDQSKYSGGLSGFNITGKGTYEWSDGQRYEGSFKDSKRHGKGTMYYADGSKHYGKWKNHLKHGKGQTYDKNGDLLVDGVWKEGVLVKENVKKKK